MDKDKIAGIALEVADETIVRIEAGNPANAYQITQFAHTFLARVQEEEGKEAVEFEMDWPNYRAEAMGCGLEDRNITNRYEAMQYGWDQAIERCAERLPEPLFLPPQEEQWISVEDRLPEPFDPGLPKLQAYYCYVPSEENKYGGTQMVLFYGRFEWYDPEEVCHDADEDGMVSRFGWHYERDSEGEYDSLTFDMNGKVSHWIPIMKPPAAKEQA